MKSRREAFWRVSALAIGLAAATSHASVTARDCVIREPAPGATRTALYFTINNQPDEETAKMRLPGGEALFGAYVPELTNYTELHTVVNKDGAMHMQQTNRIALPVGETYFKPGAEHVMLFDLVKRPVKGETYKAQILLSYVPDIICEAVVKTSEEIAMEAHP